MRSYTHERCNYECMEISYSDKHKCILDENLNSENTYHPVSIGYLVYKYLIYVQWEDDVK